MYNAGVRINSFPNPGIQQVVIYFYSVPVATSFAALLAINPDKYMVVKQDGCSVTCYTLDQRIADLARQHESQAIDLQKEALIQRSIAEKAAGTVSAVIEESVAVEPIVEVSVPETIDTKDITSVESVESTEKIEGGNPAESPVQ